MSHPTTDVTIRLRWYLNWCQALSAWLQFLLIVNTQETKYDHAAAQRWLSASAKER